MKFLLAALFLASVLCCRAYTANDAAKTIASDGSYNDTSNAVSYVAGKRQDGWVLTVGSAGGSYTWPAQLVIGTAFRFTLQGAAADNRPTLTFNHANYTGIYISASAHLVTVKDFIFAVGGTAPASNIVGIDGNGVCFRVSNCKFLNASTAGMGLQIGSINSTHTAGPFGLVDHCEFYFPGGRVYNYLNVRANGNVDNYGWKQPMTWGTANSVVVEDCAFAQPKSSPVAHVAEADGGARITLRYCNITNLAQGTHGLQSGAHSSTLQIECYENNWMFNDTGFTMPYAFWQRGGTCVVWSNTISTTSMWNLGKVFWFSAECARSADWSSESCGRLMLYPADYPIYEQLGQGVVNGAPGLVPVYCWGNITPRTSYGDFLLGGAEDSPFIQQGRDIYTNTAMPGYTPLVYPHPFVAAAGDTNAVPPAQVLPPSGLNVKSNVSLP